MIVGIFENTFHIFGLGKNTGISIQAASRHLHLIALHLHFRRGPSPDAVDTSMLLIPFLTVINTL